MNTHAIISTRLWKQFLLGVLGIALLPAIVGCGSNIMADYGGQTVPPVNADVLSALPDRDGDGIPDAFDAYPDEADHDHDGIPDGLDNDLDNDGTPNWLDPD